MRDNIRIKSTSPLHYEIRRTMSEVINRSNLEDRKKNLEMQIEAQEDALDTMKRNLAAINDALATGRGETEKETKQKSVGD
jgi:uncharacterized coiled-coil protein SlyX